MPSQAYIESEAKKAESMKSYPRKAESIITKDDLEYRYSAEECAKEVRRMRTKVGVFKSTAFFNKAVLTYQPHFFEKEKAMWKENANGLRRWILDNRWKYIYKDEYQINDKEVLRGFKISGKHIGYTHFNPLWIKAFIEKYGVKSLYDPCAGWGHRLIGAQDIHYIGNDFDSRTVAGLRRMVSEFCMMDKVLYCKDCREFTPIEEYEAVFTCPPYFNIESYNGKTFKDIHDFDDFLDRMLEKAVTPAVRVVGIVMNGTYTENVLKAARKNGLKLLETIELGRKANHFQRGDGYRLEKRELLSVFEL